MHPYQSMSFDELVEHYLNVRLPAELAEAVPLTKLPPDTQQFIQRMLALMQRAGYPATSFNPALVRWLATAIPSILPSAWGGRIPPITLPNRHVKLDAYVAKLKPADAEAQPIFVDIGCGFPPVTTADTARTLSHWQVYGIDCSFADYVLYDDDGNYACFDQDCRFLYFQGLMSLSGRALYADPQATRNRFSQLFEALLPLLPDSDDTASRMAAKNGSKLIHNHIRDFETNNLNLVKADLATLALPPAEVIRCMNVLIYFEPETRQKMVQQAGARLADEGLLITGTNGLTIQSRYAVFKKEAEALTPTEFAFSIDNLGHITFMPWFTIHANDPEAALLADLCGAIRADGSYWPGFSNRLDELLQQQDICERRSDGFLHFYDDEMPPNEYVQKNTAIWEQIKREGFQTKAIDALKAAGYEAWENPVGDIAVRPPASAFI